MIGQDDFNKIREELSGKDPLVKRVKMTSIELTDESIKAHKIIIRGTEVPVSAGFFNRLGQVVGLNVALLNKMDKKNDKLIQIKLLEAVKAYSETRDGDKDFLLIGDPVERKIVNIVNADRYGRLTNDTIFETAEVLLNEVPDLEIESIDQTANGNMSINIIHTHDHGFERLGPDEVFRFGISLVNTPNQSQIKDFMHRLSCSNGMISRDGGDGPTPLGPTGGGGGPRGGGGPGLVGPEAFQDIINQAHVWARDGFMPASFQDKLTKAIDTQASYAELKRAFSMVEGQIHDEDPDRKHTLIQAAKHQLFPHLIETERRIISKGYDPLKLNFDEMKFIRTGRTIWDLVNDLTWLGSHNSTFNMRDPKAFKVEGGSLFVKKWDLANAALASV